MTGTALTLLGLAAAAMTPPESVDFYIGTYPADGFTTGIYVSRLSLKDGVIDPPRLAAPANVPSWVQVSDDGQTVYAVHEWTGGEASAFRREADGLLGVLNSIRWNGGGPCHFSLVNQGKQIVFATYGGGTIDVFGVREDGSLGTVVSQFRNTGKSVNASRQEAPHMHFAGASPDGRHIYAADLGTDEILGLKWEEGKPEVAPSVRFRMPAGSGPRHLAFRSNNQDVYVNGELTNTVHHLRREPATGQLTLLQTLPLLPEGTSLDGKTAAAILLHPTEKWLYVTVRGDGAHAIHHFAVAEDGRLTRVASLDSPVPVPRGIAIDPTGAFLIVGGQGSNEIAVLRIAPDTGALSDTGQRGKAPAPTAIAFVPLGK